MSTSNEQGSSGVGRREFLVMTGALSATALTVGVDSALADGGLGWHEDGPADYVVGKVTARPDTGTITVSPLGEGKPLSVDAARAELPWTDGSTRPLREIGVGETVVVIGPGVGLAQSGKVKALRIVHCNIGKFEDTGRVDDHNAVETHSH